MMRWCTFQKISTICKSKRIRIFALIINCTIIMKTNSRFSWNVYAISDRIWCNKHLRHTTTEKYDNIGKGGYFRFDDDNNMNYRYILLNHLELKWASWTHTTLYIVIKIKGNSGGWGWVDPDARISPCASRMGKNAFQSSRHTSTKNIPMKTDMLGVNRQ